MNSAKTVFLEPADAVRTLRRMAYEVVETNFNSDTLVLAGIKSNGFLIAELLKSEIEAISSKQVVLASVSLDKKESHTSEASFDFDLSLAEQHPIILVDDVANTGKTVFYAFGPLLRRKCHSIQVAVLVDRKHKAFPVVPDFTGVSLSTTLQEHVEVTVSNGQVTATLV